MCSPWYSIASHSYSDAVPVPDVAPDGTFLSFPPHQVYRNTQGFPINTHDEYEMVMVHHRPLQESQVNHGMGNYLLYMTAGGCSGS